MPIRRGTLRDDDGDSADGRVFYNQISDTPDDAIVVDLRKDEESLNWTKYGPEDSRIRFSNWSDEMAHERLVDARERLREIRSQDSDSA